MIRILISCVLLAWPLLGCARRAQSIEPLAIQVSSPDADAAEPAIATAPDGTVYVVWVEHREGGGADVLLGQYDQSGVAKGPPVRVNPKKGEATAWRGDPPTVAVAPDGTACVGWTSRVPERPHSTNLYVSVSRDQGRRFEPPVKVHDDQKPGPHGMHAMAIALDNKIYVTWLDERNLPSPAGEKSKAGHKHMEANRDLFVAVSSDGGKTFSSNRQIASDVCPCCKTSLAIAPDGRIYASWRQVLPGNLRHIAVASSTDRGETFSGPVIVSDDRWMLAGCPVSGSSLSVSEGGRLQVLWYSAGEAGPTGVYSSESHDGGRSFTPRRLVAEGLAQGTPVLLTRLEGSKAIWQSDQGAKARVITASLDSGRAKTASLNVAANSQLPAASFVRDQLVIAYIRQAANDRRSVWLFKKPIV